MLTLSVATFMFVLIKELHAEARDVGFLIDDIVNYKDLEHGSFEIVTKEAVPRHIMVDNPEVMVVMEPTATGFNIQQVTNSPVQMAELLAASDEAFATYRLGQADPFTTGSIKKASGGGGFFDGFGDVHLAGNSPHTPLALQGQESFSASSFASVEGSFVPTPAHVPQAGSAAAAVDDDGLPGGKLRNTGDLNAGKSIFAGLLGG